DPGRRASGRRRPGAGGWWKEGRCGRRGVRGAEVTGLKDSRRRPIAVSEPGNPPAPVGARQPPSPVPIQGGASIATLRPFFCPYYCFRFLVAGVSAASGFGASTVLPPAVVLSLRALPRFLAAEASFFC